MNHHLEGVQPVAPRRALRGFGRLGLLILAGLVGLSVVPVGAVATPLTARGRLDVAVSSSGAIVLRERDPKASNKDSETKKDLQNKKGPKRNRGSESNKGSKSKKPSKSKKSVRNKDSKKRHKSKKASKNKASKNRSSRRKGSKKGPKNKNVFQNKKASGNGRTNKKGRKKEWKNKKTTPTKKVAKKKVAKKTVAKGGNASGSRNIGHGGASKISTRSVGGAYALPVPRRHVSRRALRNPHHDYPAWDIGVPRRTPVFSVTAGRVRRIIDDGRCGRGLEVRGRDGILYVYCHGRRVVVRHRQWVRAGQTIMRSGNTGRSTGPHLHLQMRRPFGALVCPQGMLQSVAGGRRWSASMGTSGGCHYFGKHPWVIKAEREARKAARKAARQAAAIRFDKAKTRLWKVKKSFKKARRAHRKAQRAFKRHERIFEKARRSYHRTRRAAGR